MEVSKVRVMRSREVAVLDMVRLYICPIMRLGWALEALCL